MKPFHVGLIVLTVATAAPAMAQQSAPKDSAKKNATVPAGVPAAQQPAATDCPTAIKNRPNNGRVIFGDDYADSSKAKTADKAKLPADVKGFTGVKPPPQILPKRPPG